MYGNMLQMYGNITNTVASILSALHQTESVDICQGRWSTLLYYSTTVQAGAQPSPALLIQERLMKLALLYEIIKERTPGVVEGRLGTSCFIKPWRGSSLKLLSAGEESQTIHPNKTRIFSQQHSYTRYLKTIVMKFKASSALHCCYCSPLERL